MRVYRLYREEGLSLRLKRPRRNKAAQLRPPKQLARPINEIWSMDFVSDALFDGPKLHMLTVVDPFARGCLATDITFVRRSRHQDEPYIGVRRPQRTCML